LFAEDGFLENRFKNNLFSLSFNFLHTKLDKKRFNRRMDMSANMTDSLCITLLLKNRVSISNNTLDNLLISFSISENIKEAFDGVGTVAKQADTKCKFASFLANSTKEELLTEFSEKIIHTLFLSRLRLVLSGSASTPLLPDVFILGSKRTDTAALDFADILLWVCTDGRDGDLGHRSVLGPENDTSIDGADTTLADKERIDIDLLDEWVISSEITKGNKKRFKLLHVDWTLTTNTLKSLVDLGLRHAKTSEVASERRKDKSTVLVNFDKLATSTKHDNRTKLWVAVGTKKNFVALLDLKHRLYADTKEVLLPFIRIKTLDVIADSVECSSNSISITNVQDNTTNIRFVSDSLTVKLDYNRIADLGSSSDSILSSLCRDGFRDRNATKGKNLLALSFTENGTTSLTNFIHDLINLSDRGANLTSTLKDRVNTLVELIKMMTITIKSGEASSSFISEHKHGNTATTKKATSTLTIITTKEDTNKGLFRMMLSE